MVKSVLQVTYISVWDEGTVETIAYLNTKTGEIFEIEAVETPFEYHKYDEIQVGEKTALVEVNDDNHYFISTSDLKKILS
jgi:cobalamin biosynthesis protein CbiG